ncbi:MAG: S9 family peptidase [gamma proteobacterium endosymbiont of Lamellibrachia anaximandri]|nr:S9 family peptidase [gamma proteobacterium endosymbiont of Lamellibrachia anaximandri]MBL3617491.1 S9 family peptidase [gamma proteobacterium endosymbiont of Lamellibrachia anaximandri]
MISKYHSQFVFLVCLIFLAGCRWADRPAAKVNSSPAIKQYTIGQFLATTQLKGSSFSPDKSKILVSSDEEGIDNAFAILEDGSGSVQLTDSKAEAIQVQGYFPHDERFLFLADRSGNELDHLYVREMDGTQTDLTPGSGLQARFLGWAQDGKSLFLSTNERESHYFDIYEVQVDGYIRNMIYKDEMGYEFHEVSPDKQTIAFVRTNKRDDSDILLYNQHTNSMRHLTTHEGNVEYKFQVFSRDSQSIYYTSNQGSEFSYLVREHLLTGRREVVLKPNWDVMFAKLSHFGKYLIAGINRDGQTVLELFDGRTIQRLELSSLPKGDITSVSFSGDESMMSFNASTSRTPGNVYVYDFSTEAVRRLTWTLNPEINERDLVDGEVVRFDSFDGLNIPGILYKPHDASPDNKVPALVLVHGGPGGQSRVEYHELIQYLVNHGYAIYAINNRGSSGYGKTFFTADDRRHGQADLDDCVASKSMLIDTDYIDPERIGIIGGSYGGYMTLAAMSFRPNEFAVGVDIFGISNWVRTLQNMPPWWEPLRESLYLEIGHPEHDRDYLESISPLFHADRIVRPLMVLQGANDPRVGKSESDDIVAAVKGKGVPVEYLVFEDEGHKFHKKENRLVAYRSILSFLDRYLKTENL